MLCGIFFPIPNLLERKIGPIVRLKVREKLTRNLVFFSVLLGKFVGVLVYKPPIFGLLLKSKPSPLPEAQ